MDKLKYIRTQNQDGVYGQKIPLTIDSTNVVMQDGSTLQESLLSLRRIIANKKDIDGSKVLSTNDYTTAEKNKLAGIEAGANKIVIDSSLSYQGQAADAKAVRDKIAELKAEVNLPPIAVKKVSQMINTNKVYVYTPEEGEEEQGYKFGYWYYYDGTKWAEGGSYQEAAVAKQLTEYVTQQVDTLTQQTDQAVQKAEDAQDRLTVVEGKLNTDENDINILKSKVTGFVDDGYVDNGVAYFTNNDVVLFEITGIGGGGGGGDDPQESEYWSVKSKNWAVGPTGGGNPTDVNNSKYWSTQSATYAGQAQTAAQQAQTYLQTEGQQWIQTLETKESQLEGQLGTYGTNIKTQMTTLAESYIHGNTGTRTGEDTDNSQYYTNRAKLWAVGITDSSIPSDSNNAKYWAEHAADVVDEQGQYWTDLAESWTQGGTGSRQDEDTNNAKYWAQQSEDFYNNIQNNCVTSFNGRSETVTPTNGDYTAAMITRNESTVDADLQAVETVVNNKIDKTNPLIDLDTDEQTASAEDLALYNAIFSLGWDDTVIIN